MVNRHFCVRLVVCLFVHQTNVLHDKMYFVAGERVNVAIILLSLQTRHCNEFGQDLRERGHSVDTLSLLMQSGQHRAYGHPSPSLQDLARHEPVLVWDIVLCKLPRQCLVDLPDHVRNVLATQDHHNFICTKQEKAVVWSS